MNSKVFRKIIQIEESLCNGCGECVNSCAEGALALVNGKARLVKEKYCDGLAACLKECPQGALRIAEREAEDFDAEAVKTHLQENEKEPAHVGCACQGASVRQIERTVNESKSIGQLRQEPLLSHWPVQLTLVPPGAKFLEQANVMLISDCVPFAYPDLHQDFLKDHSILVACPKLDNAQAHLEQLTAVLQKSAIKSLTVVRMEVPCCSGLTHIAEKAIEASRKEVPFQEIIIGIKGDIKSG